MLEFRHDTQFDFKNLSKTEAFWNRASETIAANRDEWKAAARPSAAAPLATAEAAD